MTLYLQLRGDTGLLHGSASSGAAAQLAPVRVETPPESETFPSPWLVLKDRGDMNLIDLDQPYGRIELARIIAGIPLYRIALELLVDKILMDSRQDPVRAKGVRAAFTPDEPPEPLADPMSERYGFAGVLHFPVIASRTDAQLVDLYLRLYGSACPEHETVQAHMAAMLGGHPERLTEHCDGFLWRNCGWVRLDRLVYDAERVDTDPEITFESYVARGRAAAEGLAINEPKALLAAWIAAERVQRELCRDMDIVLSLPDIRRLPRWVRADVFRILEREAMKQVFADSLTKTFAEWPELRRVRNLAEPIEANAKGEVSPLVQQIMNQTLSADARYAGAAGAFALAAERRRADAKKLLG